MSRIRGKDTAPEMRVRRRLHTAGLRYRLHAKHLPGQPDLVLASAATVVFVHGCFWHQHRGCEFAYMPGTNVAFWRNKLLANVERDARVARQLTEAGWLVETVWECAPNTRIDQLIESIRVRQAAARHPG